MANPVGPPGTWTQVFEDLFDGPGLNTANWTALQGANINNVTTQASAVSVSGGNCRLLVPSTINSNPANDQYGSGSNGPLLKVGYCAEASINFPGPSGDVAYNWPAWWSAGGNWPAAGELDIWESYDGVPSAMNYHGPSGANNGPHPPGNWCNAFHTYTVVRNASSASVWWDGVLMRTVSTNDNGAPQSLLITAGAGNTSNASAVVLVDYVRVWSPGGTGGSSPTVVTSAATSITDTAVTLNGTVNPNSLASTYQFEYGTTTGYGTATPGSPGSVGAGSAAISESANVTGLTASTGYHYRLNATNSGGLTHGSDQAFTTQVTPGGGGGGGGGGSLPALAYSNTQSAISAAPALVQSKSATGTSATTLTVTLDSTTTAGNCLIVCVSSQDGTTNPTVSAMTLGGAAGNFAASNTANSNLGINTVIWADPNCSGGQTSVVISFTGGTGGSPGTAAWVMEWSGLATASVVDAHPAGADAQGSSWSSGSTGTLAQASEVAVGAVGAWQTSGTITTPGAPWTELTQAGAISTCLLGAGYQVTSATTALTYNGTANTSVYYGTCIATFKAATGGGAGTLTSTSFTPQTGDIIVVKLVAEDAGVTFNTPTGGGWTYTSRVSDTTASHVSARIYTAPVTAGGTPQTVAETPTWGAFANALMTVELWRGAQLAATPATCDMRGTGAPSTTLATTAANSVVSWTAGDWAEVNGASRVYNTTSATPTDDGYVFSAGHLTAYSAYQSAVTAGAQTLGLTAPGGQTWTLAGIEIQSTGGGGGGGSTLSYRATPAVTTSSGNVSSWTVNKQAGTAAGDWIFIYLYGCNYATGVSCTGFTVREDPNQFGALLYRLADGTEGSTFTITGLGGAAPATTVIATIAGATTALDPATAPAPVSGGLSTTIPVSGITLANTGDWLLWFAANESNWGAPGFAISPPPGFTSQATNGAAAANATVMLADNENPGTGATGAKTGTFTSPSYYSGVMVGVTAGTPGSSSSPGATPATAAGTARNATVTTSGAAKAIAGLATGTGLAIQPAAVLSGSATPAAAAASAAGAALNATVQASPGIAWFPAKPLSVTIELLLNGAWTDISVYVYLRNPVQISGFGRADWTSQIQAAQATLTLNNRDGRFSPKNSSGAFFPFITRNVQIRVSVSAQSVTGQAYSGVRFWGEVAEWPVRWSPSAQDIYVDIVANGIWRRMSQLATTLGSAYTRYNALTLGGSAQPRCYWPMEDGTGSGQLVPYDSTAGTANAVQSFITGAAGLSLAACTDFKGSDGIPQFNGASITATVPAGGTPTVNCTRFLLSVPAAGDSAQGTTAGNIAEIDSTGTVAKFEVYLNPAAQGTLLMHLVNSAGAVIAAGTTTTVVKGRPVLVSCELTPSGGDVAFALRIIAQGAAGITESLTGVLAGASVGAVTTVKFSRANVLADTAVGHLSVTYGTVPLMVPAAYALGGYAGEKAMDRFTRVCGEMGITTQTIGVPSVTAPMGPQVDDTLTNVLQSVEDTDCGLLYETRDQFGLGYRSAASMANQVISATFSYPGATLDTSLAPTYDDSLTRNNVTVTNWTGWTQQAILTAGPMSVLNPPNGIGNGYALTRAVNAAADAQLPGIATFLLGQGTVDEIRFPVVTLRMARQSNAALFTAVPGLRIGDYFQITGAPAFLTSTNIRQLAWGYSETLGAKQWDFSFNSVPETPWETGFSPGTIQTAQIPGGAAVTSAAPGAGGLGGIIANGAITPAMLSGGITVHTLGGSAITLSSGPPANPNTDDIWIDSDTGLLSQWNGTAWIPYKLDASQTIQAGTIVAANIAASTITASLLAAGIVVTGIVDATTINGAQFVATGASGEILVYSGTPAAGNLIGAWSGTAGTDAFGNAFAANISTSNLTAFQPGSSPVALETWHTLGPIGNGWTTNHGRYRRTATNEIQLDVSLQGSGSTGLLTWPNTMPAAYRPIVVRRLPGVPNGSTTSHSTINTDGTISSNIPTGAATFDCCGRVPLD